MRFAEELEKIPEIVAEQEKQARIKSIETKIKSAVGEIQGICRRVAESGKRYVELYYYHDEGDADSYGHSGFERWDDGRGLIYPITYLTKEERILNDWEKVINGIQMWGNEQGFKKFVIRFEDIVEISRNQESYGKIIKKYRLVDGYNRTVITKDNITKYTSERIKKMLENEEKCIYVEIEW